MIKLGKLNKLPMPLVNKWFMSGLVFLFLPCIIVSLVFSQDNIVDFNLDTSSKTKATPRILKKPGIDLSGRGFHNDPTWPQNLAAAEAIEGFSKHLDLQGGIYRLQFDLWEFVELAKNKQMQEKFLENYSAIIKNINAAGGITLINLYGMPPGLGKVLDKRSSPWDIKAFKQLVKEIIRYLSCKKGYNIWYEVWSAPDLDDFFSGEKKEYFSIYQAVAESVKELERETSRNIPIGGPGSTWWFQNIGGNTSEHPEKSLIYEFIRFCSHRKLPLDFISWHSYTSNPSAESERTTYKKIAPKLIREWLSYFGLSSTIPLMISEWNYDVGLNFELKRGWESYVAASLIPSRIKNMLKAGIDYQIFFCLEDFKNNKQGVNQNVGLFWYEPEYVRYTGGPKSMFNVVRMMNMLGDEMFLSSRLDNEFVGIIATKTQTGFSLLLFNYIDPEIANNYLSNHLAQLHPKRARGLVRLMNSKAWKKILDREISVQDLRLHRKVKAKIKEALDLQERADYLLGNPQQINLKLTNLNDSYIYKKYVVDSNCRLDCSLEPQEEKDIIDKITYAQTLELDPYTVVLITLDKKIVVPPATTEAPQVESLQSQEPVADETKETEEDIKIEEELVADIVEGGE